MPVKAIKTPNPASVAKKCSTCRQECKQPGNAVVMFCPHYERSVRDESGKQDKQA
jgi:hypothetical protein